MGQMGVKHTVRHAKPGFRGPHLEAHLGPQIEPFSEGLKQGIFGSNPVKRVSPCGKR